MKTSKDLDIVIALVVLGGIFYILKIIFFDIFIPILIPTLIAIPTGICIYMSYFFIRDLMKDRYFESEEFIWYKSQISEAVREYNELAKYVSSFDTISLTNKFSDRYKYKHLATYENTSIYNMQRNRNRKTIANNIHHASLAVVRRASEEPFKYLCKYFNLKPNEENLELIQELGETVSRYVNAKQNLDNRLQKIKSTLNPPNFIIKHYYSEFLQQINVRLPHIKFHYPKYVFEYVSAGGNSSQRTTITLNEQTIDALINYIDKNITNSKTASVQRALMTKKLREFIKRRDNFTCQNCLVSTSDQSLLLLEVDHIIPVSKGGLSTVDNLQTLCWKCNRAKSNKLITEEI